MIEWAFVSFILAVHPLVQCFIIVNLKKDHREECNDNVHYVWHLHSCIYYIAVFYVVSVPIPDKFCTVIRVMLLLFGMMES